MKDKSFLLVSLKGDKAKKLAQVINNDTSRSILDYLSKHKSATETSISKELDLPLSTVHYNMKALMESKLVNADEFHYSEKGKEVNHYSLANKFVIIAQEEEDEGLLDKLKKLLPAFITVGFGGALIVLLDFLKGAQDNMVVGASKAMDAALPQAEAAAEPMLKAADTCAVQAISQCPEPNIIMWFAIGAIFAFASLLFWEWVRRLMRK